MTDLHLQKIVVDTSCLVSNQRPYDRPQRSWAKVMFLQASVILLTGGGLPQCMLGYTPWEQTPPTSRHPHEQTPPHRHPPGTDTPLWEQTPPRADTPKSRHPSEQTPPRVDNPQSRHPPESRHLPRKQTPAYGQRAAGTHPTGMHSC